MRSKNGLGGRKTRRGSIVILVAISMFVVFAFLAISIDGGVLLDRKRHTQATADAAALAAAESIFRAYPTNQGLDPEGEASNAALRVAELNGLSNDGESSKVTVRCSPDSYLGGPNAGLPLPAGYVEVNVEYYQSRYFSSVLGVGTIPIQARAVARGNWEAAGVGIHVLDLHEPAAIKATGESSLTVLGASIIVNSDNEDAATSTGGLVTAPAIDIMGGTSVSGGKGGFDADLNFGVPASPDPLRHIPEPQAKSYPLRSHRPIHISKGNKKLQPGVYEGGVSVSGQGSLTMEPGIYYMDSGGFSFSGQGSLVAEGVMIFNAPSANSHVVSITGTGDIVMSPPNNTVYKGLTLFQARSSPNTLTVSGGGYMNISGTFYTANGTLKVGGGGESRVGSQYVSRLLEIVGGGNLLIEYNKNTAIPRRVFHLVE